MASTRGTKRRPLPQSLVTGLESLGLVESPSVDDHIHIWVLPRHPGLTVQMATTNMPGESAVIVQFGGGYPGRLEADDVLDRLVDAITILDSPNGRRVT
jgi:hypothetical protein